MSASEYCDRCGFVKIGFSSGLQDYRDPFFCQCSPHSPFLNLGDASSAKIDEKPTPSSVNDDYWRFVGTDSSWLDPTWSTSHTPVTEPELARTWIGSSNSAEMGLFPVDSSSPNPNSKASLTETQEEEELKKVGKCLYEEASLSKTEEELKKDGPTNETEEMWLKGLGEQVRVEKLGYLTSIHFKCPCGSGSTHRIVVDNLQNIGFLDP